MRLMYESTCSFINKIDWTKNIQLDKKFVNAHCCQLNIYSITWQQNFSCNLSWPTQFAYNWHCFHFQEWSPVFFFMNRFQFLNKNWKKMKIRIALSIKIKSEWKKNEIVTKFDKKNSQCIFLQFLTY